MFFHVWIELESNEMGLFTSWVYCSVHSFVCLPLLFHSKHIVAMKMCRSHVCTVRIWWIDKNVLIFSIYPHTHTQCHHLFYKKNLELQFLFIHKMDISLENDLPTSYASRIALGYVEPSNLLTKANWLKITAHLDVFFDGGHTKKVPLPFPNENRFFFIRRIIYNECNFYFYNASNKYAVSVCHISILLGTTMTRTTQNII